MNHLHQLPSGCSRHLNNEGQQWLPLGCSLSNTYLVKNCGTCHDRCQVLFNSSFNEWNAVTPDNTHLPTALSEVYGLGFTSNGTAIDVQSLPARVPLVWQNPDTLPADHSMYAVSATSLFSKAVTRNGVTYHGCRDVRRKLGISPGATLILMGNAKDDLLQWMWENQDTVVNVIGVNSCEYVTTPSYSVYGNKCPLEWAYNLKRSMLYGDKLRAVTPNVIQTVALPNSTIFHRYVEWMSANPAVNCIALNFQMRKPEAEFSDALNDAARLREAVGRPLHFIVAGPSTEWRTQLVHEVLGQATIVSSYYYNR